MREAVKQLSRSSPQPFVISTVPEDTLFPYFLFAALHF